MKKINLLYWIFTGLFCFMMAGSAIPDILMSPVAVQGMHHELGYPLYFIAFIGYAKALGALTVLLPMLPSRLKEWAYAGLTFDLVGALFSLASAGKPDWMFLFIPLALCACSYFLYHKRRAMKLGAVALPRERAAASAA
jgi:hypothetical protein